MENSKVLVDQWRNKSEEDINQKEDFLHQSKIEDPIALPIAKVIMQKVNCLDCGNCCRTSVTDFNSSDIKRAAKYLQISPKAFRKKYLMEDMDGAFVTTTSPCPFLSLQDNTCSIYEARPFVCQSYPHVDRKGFSNRIKAHKANLRMCPISYHVVDEMQKLIDG